MVTRLLQDPKWGKWSSNEIARRCGVGHTLVDTIRAELGASLAADASETRQARTKHGGTTTMRTGRIGKGKRKPAAASQPAAADGDRRSEHTVKADDRGNGQGTAEAAGGSRPSEAPVMPEAAAAAAAAAAAEHDEEAEQPLEPADNVVIAKLLIELATHLAGRETNPEKIAAYLFEHAHHLLDPHDDGVDQGLITNLEGLLNYVRYGLQDLDTGKFLKAWHAKHGDKWILSAGRTVGLTKRLSSHAIGGFRLERSDEKPIKFRVVRVEDNGADEASRAGGNGKAS